MRVRVHWERSGEGVLEACHDGDVAMGLGRISASRPVTQRSSLPRQELSYLMSSTMFAFRKRDDGGGRQSAGGRMLLLRQRDSSSRLLWRGFGKVSGRRMGGDGTGDGVSSGADAHELSFWAVHCDVRTV